MNHRAAYFALLLLLTASAGANCQRWVWQPQAATPAVLPAQASLSQVIAVVNDNRARVASIRSSQALLSTPGAPSMRAEVAIGGPRHLRLTAGTGLTGSEVDLGSNEEIFWFWIKRNEPPGVYFARHDAFAVSQIRQSIPIQPEWLVEAFGLVYLDPNGAHQGPFVRQDGRLEVHTTTTTPAGPATRVLVVDPQTGWVVEQHLLSSNRQILASAFNSRHLRDPQTGFVMPRRTDLSFGGNRMSLELSDLAVNPLDLSPELWIKPTFEGYPDRDLTQMASVSGGQLPGPPASAPSRYR
ncbi:MAG: hypothetical protein DWQ35_06995 [Planctomycetota bacterium]|nr:MAG: hypothetical protein DWQ35_06995 [Planctomycetota bacterium]REK30227.1 MAG: hypothetical protein DWQ42_02305 [Planctomycetota bacterium]REK44638.1 MAG: hypothetical protein DWQ46_08970 [Planctomycetota bacterium]